MVDRSYPLQIQTVRRPPITIDPSVPRFQATWHAVAVQLLAMSSEWLHEAVPVNRYGGDDGARVTRVSQRWLQERIAAANGALRDVCRVSGEQLDGWELRFCNLNQFPVTRSLILIAVDPSGIGHDIAALADGRDAGF